MAMPLNHGLVFSFAALVAAAPAYAALAPQYRRLAELNAVINEHSVVSALFQHGPITRVEAMDDGSFRVHAGKCFVNVKLLTDNQQTAPGQQVAPGSPDSYRAEVAGTVHCQ